MQKKQLGIFGIDDNTKKVFEECKEKRGLTSKQLFLEMIDCYLNNMDFIGEEQELINQAIHICKRNKNDFVKEAVFAYCKKFVKPKDSPLNIKTKDAYKRLGDFIDHLIDLNNTASDINNKKYISQTLVLREALKSGKTFNVKVVRRYLMLEEIKDKLAKHHKQHNLKENHNKEALSIGDKQD